MFPLAHVKIEKHSFRLTLRSRKVLALYLYDFYTGMSSSHAVPSCSSVFVYMAQVQTLTSVRVIAVRVYPVAVLDRESHSGTK